MKKQEFISQLIEELEIEKEIHLETIIKDIDEWDSMGVMILISFVSDNFGIELNADDIEALTTFESLIEKIGTDNFED